MRGALEVPAAGMPQTTDTPGWTRYLKKINSAIKTSGDKAYIAAVITLADRLGIPLDDVLQLIGDDGRLTSQFALPTVNVGNVSSVQSPEPLSASSNASTATVYIAGHILQTDFGPIPYNAGSISGLLINTRYYITANDPNYIGGAVTYLATTSKPSVTTASGTYLVGSIITPVAANSVNITNATGTNPIAFTTAIQDWVTGNKVQFGGLPGDFGSNLNGQQKTITVISPTSFSVAVDGTLYAAYTSGGSAQRIVDDSFPDYGGGGGGALP